MADIVEQLRDEAAKVVIDRARGLDVSSKDVTGSVIWKAADEIERLRLEVTALSLSLEVPPSQSEDRAETAVVAANALQARVYATEAALREQVDACYTDDCEMCHRHRAILASTPSPSPRVRGSE